MKKTKIYRGGAQKLVRPSVKATAGATAVVAPKAAAGTAVVVAPKAAAGTVNATAPKTTKGGPDAAAPKTTKGGPDAAAAAATVTVEKTVATTPAMPLGVSTPKTETVTASPDAIKTEVAQVKALAAVLSPTVEKPVDGQTKPDTVTSEKIPGASDAAPGKNAAGTPEKIPGASDAAPGKEVAATGDGKIPGAPDAAPAAPKPKKTKSLVKELEKTKKKVNESKDKITLIDAKLTDPKTSKSTRAKLIKEREGHVSTISAASEKITASSDTIKQRNDAKLQVIETSPKVVRMKKKLAKKLGVHSSNITLKDVVDANPGSKAVAEITKLTTRKANSNTFAKSISNIKTSSAPEAVKPLTYRQAKSTKRSLKSEESMKAKTEYSISKLKAKQGKKGLSTKNTTKLAAQEKILEATQEKITTIQGKILASHEATKTLSNAKLKAVAVKHSPTSKTYMKKTAKHTGRVTNSSAKLKKMGVKVPEAAPAAPAAPAASASAGPAAAAASAGPAAAAAGPAAASAGPGPAAAGPGPAAAGPAAAAVVSQSREDKLARIKAARTKVGSDGTPVSSSVGKTLNVADKGASVASNAALASMAITAAAGKFNPSSSSVGQIKGAAGVMGGVGTGIKNFGQSVGSFFGSLL